MYTNNLINRICVVLALACSFCSISWRIFSGKSSLWSSLATFYMIALTANLLMYLLLLHIEFAEAMFFLVSRFTCTCWCLIVDSLLHLLDMWWSAFFILFWAPGVASVHAFELQFKDRASVGSLHAFFSNSKDWALSFL